MIINESFRKKTYYKKKNYNPTKILNLDKSNLKQKKIPTSIILNNPKFSNHNNHNLNNSTTSISLLFKKTNRKNSEIEIRKDDDQSHNSSNQKISISKYLNESIPNEKNISNKTLFDTKEHTYRSTMKYSKYSRNFGKINKNVYTKIKNENNNHLNNKNSLLKKLKKTFLTNKDFKNKDANLLRVIQYKKRLKKINSSFSQDSIYNLDKKFNKDFTSKNFLYNDSMFNDSKDLNYSNISKNKINRSHKNINNYDQIENKRIQKYKFIINPIFSIKQLNMKKFYKNMEKIGKNVENIIDNTVKVKTDNIFSLVNKSKFDEKYKNISIYERQTNINKIKFKDKYKNILDDNVYKDKLQFLKMVTEEVDKLKEDRNIKKFKEKPRTHLNKKRSLIERFKRTVIKLSNFIRQRKIPEKEFRNYKLIEHSFTYPETEDLINAIKFKNLDLCYKILDTHKYIVLDFDYFYLTPLHWAVKYNFYRILPTLLDYGSILDSHDFVGETPLHISVKNNYNDCTCILLFYLASPFVKDKNGKRPIDLTRDFEVKNLLEKVMKLHYSSYFQKTFIQDLYIQSGLLAFIKEEFNYKLQKEVLDYFKEKEIKDIFNLRY